MASTFIPTPPTARALLADATPARARTLAGATTAARNDTATRSDAPARNDAPARSDTLERGTRRSATTATTLRAPSAPRLGHARAPEPGPPPSAAFLQSLYGPGV